MQISNNFKSQSGAILAFCLVMLLLLTLSGTRMIQQNKQQLEISNSVRLLTQEFANAEAVLADAKNTINKVGDNGAAHDNYYDDSYFPVGSKLSIYHPAHQCTPTASYKQQIGLAGVVSGTDSKATILSVSCLAPFQKCTSYDKTTQKLTCHPKSGDVNCDGKTIEAVAALFSDPTDICYQLYDPLCANPNGGSNPAITASTNAIDNYNPNPRCRSEPPTALSAPACPKEVYKIDVIATSANGTTREIISDHVVGCGT